MILVPLGPAQRKEEGGRVRRRRRRRGRNKTTPLKNTRQKTASTLYINNIN